MVMRAIKPMFARPCPVLNLLNVNHVAICFRAHSTQLVGKVFPLAACQYPQTRLDVPHVWNYIADLQLAVVHIITIDKVTVVAGDTKRDEATRLKSFPTTANSNYY
jgi:hypothetical protein